MTLCTIAIPVYNRAHLVCAALDSALAQEAQGLEILVIDNCSTDGTWDALQSYRDPRLRLVRNDSNVGLYGNLNRCLELAQGEYVRILCSDDRLVPGCIAGELALLRRHPEVTLLSTQGRMVDKNNHLLRAFANDLGPGIYNREDAIVSALWYLAHYEGCPYNYPSGVMARRETALRVGGFDMDSKQLGDLDLWLKLAGQGPIAVSDQIGCDVLSHNEQTTSTLIAQGDTTQEWFQMIQKYAPELQARGVYRRVYTQIAATSLWFAVYFLRKRRLDIARRYWQTGRAQNKNLFALALSFGLHVWLKALWRIAKIQSRPPITPMPL